ncbi:unnamed protein product [Mytilus edulis]|uniref:Uncharacterized protein n=1 Tax=Mytilus edulis TaxID=6550 RepID=A0A8S3S1J7_MYTED|nr:unnamed protein product [Mytilus edulis]
MTVLGPLLLYVFSISFACAFLLDDKTPSPNNGLSDKHYIAVIELLGEETKARQQLEVAVTQLHRDLVAKTSNIAAFQDQTNLIKDLKSKLQNMENKTDILEQKYQQVQSENAAIHKSHVTLQQELFIIKSNYSVLHQIYSGVERNYSKLQSQHYQLIQKLLVRENQSAEIVKEITALKQLKAIDQLQDISALQTETEALKHQVHSLTSNQAARGQDFLALYNQTLAFRSDALVTAKLSKHNNESLKEVMQNLQKENQTTSQMINNINTTMQYLTNQTTYQLKKQMDSEIKRLEQEMADENMARGTTYVRWSRKQCPNNGTELVYSGYVGGGRYSDTGSAAEPVCLPSDPDFVQTSGGSSGHMYGAEFNSRVFASNSMDQDVPCAVCRVKQASSVIMIPGKNRCYTGWNMEYHGYLASNYYSHAAAGSFVCIDIQPEYISGGTSLNSNSKHFYAVVAQCGVLKCPPYKNNYPLTCVVCSK